MEAANWLLKTIFLFPFCSFSATDVSTYKMADNDGMNIDENRNRTLENCIVVCYIAMTLIVLFEPI